MGRKELVPRWSNYLLIAISYGLYLQWKPVYALVLLGVTAVTYLAALKIERDKAYGRKKYIVCSGLILAALPLLVFKYYNFLNDCITGLLGGVNVQVGLPDYLSSYRSSGWQKNGYSRPGNAKLDPKTVNYGEVNYTLDSLKWFYAERFVKEVSSKTKLIFVASPMYSFHTDHGGLTKIKELCKQYNVPVIDHFCDGDFVDNPDLYIDMAHLNREGAEKWSRLIASELKSEIEK